MAVKSGPQWSQVSTPKLPPRIVYTRANTNFEQWKIMLREHMVLLDIADYNLQPLAVLHAWEFGDTPVSYATSLWERKRKSIARSV
jgi:hypothetical protein